MVMKTKVSRGYSPLIKLSNLTNKTFGASWLKGLSFLKSGNFLSSHIKMRVYNLLNILRGVFLNRRERRMDCRAL